MRLPDLVIPNGQTASNEVDVLHVGEATLFAPAALTAVVTIQISPDKGVTWYNLQTIAINVRELISQLNASLIRVLSAGAEGAERTFPLHATE